MNRKGRTRSAQRGSGGQLGRRQRENDSSSNRIRTSDAVADVVVLIGLKVLLHQFARPELDEVKCARPQDQREAGEHQRARRLTAVAERSFHRRRMLAMPSAAQKRRVLRGERWTTSSKTLGRRDGLHNTFKSYENTLEPPRRGGGRNLLLLAIILRWRPRTSWHPS